LKLNTGGFSEELKSEFKHFYKDYAVDWGVGPLQPIERCVEHIVTQIIRQIEDNSRGEDNLKVTPKEAANWAKEFLYTK